MTAKKPLFTNVKVNSNQLARDVTTSGVIVPEKGVRIARSPIFGYYEPASARRGSDHDLPTTDNLQNDIYHLS
jgi:hypothetical protein